MELTDVEKRLIEIWRKKKEESDNPDKIFIAIGDERYFEPFDYVSIKLIEDKITEVTNDISNFNNGYRLKLITLEQLNRNTSIAHCVRNHLEDLLKRSNE